MMRKLIEKFVHYPILANIIIGVTIIAGVQSCQQTKYSFLPTFSTKQIRIQAVFPGASPEEMEEGITLKIEEEIYNIVGIDEISSTSSENSATISVSTLKGYDIDEILADIKNAVDGISSFPAGLEKVTVYKVRNRSTAQWVSLSGENLDLKTLKQFAKGIEDDFLATGIISQVNLSGYNALEISIEVPEETLRRYNMTFDMVTNAVKANNQDISAGTIKSSKEEILIRSKNKQTEADRIGDIVLRSNADGSKLLLRDVAIIKEQFSEEPNEQLVNGVPAVFLEIRKLEDEDLNAISDYVRDYADKFNESNDGVVHMDVLFDFKDYVDARVNLLGENAFYGLILVLISLGIFLSLRLSLWVAWGIPSSFLGMFIIGTFYGLTINMVSLFGMIVVIGILVDDGIVIAENIYSHFERSKNPVSAAIHGTMEVLPAVTTSVLTTIVAFFPLMLLDTLEFFKDLGFVVVASLAFSLLEAFFVLPAHLASKKVLAIKEEGSRGANFRGRIQKVIDWMRYDLYGNALRWTMKYKTISFALVFSLFILVGGMFAGEIISFTLFPNFPVSNFQLNLEYKPGTREDVVRAKLKEFEQAINEVNDEMMEEYDSEERVIKTMITSVGNQATGSRGSHLGGINVFPGPIDDMNIDGYEIIKRVRDRIGDVPEAENFSIGRGSMFGKPVSVRMMGDNMDRLQEAKGMLQSKLNELPDLKDVTDNLQLGRREMLFDLTPQAYFLGLTYNDITRQIRQGFFGEEAQRLQIADEEVKVWVRYPKEDRKNIGQVEDMKIKTVTQEQYPLTTVADYKIERGIAGISHLENKRTITVEADLSNPYAEVPPIQAEIKNNIIPEVQAAFPDVEISYGGQSRSGDRAIAEMVNLFSIALFVIIFLIILHFRSFYQGVLIIAMIPLGWIGAILGHLVTGIPVSLFSVLGMVALMGVIINDAVVFLDKYNRLLKDEGLSVKEAAFQAGIARFRPIMLTSITTVVGLFPLILDNSFSAKFLIPMAVSVAYGVLIGTFIILLFFPVLILIFNDVRVYAKYFWVGHKPKREEVERVIIDSKRDDLFEHIS